MSEILPNGQLLDNQTVPAGQADYVEGTEVILQGTLVNAGTFQVSGGYDDATQMEEPGTLAFAGQVAELENTGLLQLYDAQLTNQSGYPTATDYISNDGTITGGGTIGLGDAGTLAIDNTAGGTIEASYYDQLTIDTAGGTLVNAGVITNAETNEFSYEFDGYIPVLGDGVTLDDTVVRNLGTIEGGVGANFEQSGESGDNELTGGAEVIGGVLGVGPIDVVGSATLDGLTAGAITLGTYETTSIKGASAGTLLGTIDILGTLQDDSAGSYADIVLGSPTVTLEGGGAVVLSDQATNRIYANAAATLVNADVLYGAGQIGRGSAGPITVIDEVGGTIAATGTSELVIDTEGQALTDAGLLAATGRGGLQLFSTPVDVTATGTVAAFPDSRIFSDGSLVNDAAGTLTGGTYEAGAFANSGDAYDYGLIYPIDAAAPAEAGGGTLDFVGGAPVTTLAATVVLDSTLSAITIGGVALPASLTTVAAGGMFSMPDGGNTTFSHALTVEADGSLFVGGGTLAAPSLAVLAGAQVTGTGTLAAATDVAGLVEALARPLTFTGEVTGSGTLDAVTGDITFDGGAALAGATLLAGAGQKFDLQSGIGTLDGSAAPVTVDAGFQLDNGETLDLLGAVDLGGTLNSGSGVDLVVASPTVTLDGTGAVALGQDAVTVLNVGTLAADGNRGSLVLSGGSLHNTGLLLAAGAAVSFDDAALDNTGTVEAGPGQTVGFDGASAVQNLADGTLTGGTWIADAGGSGAAGISFGSGAVTAIAASVTLDGPGSVLTGDGEALEATLGSIEAGGTLALLDGRGAAFGGAVTIGNEGGLELGGGVLGASALAVQPGGELSGYGTVDAPVDNAGLILASGGTLDLADGVTGAGTLQVARDADLVLGGSVAGTVAYTPGAVGTLTLAAADDAPAAIAGLASGDVLDIQSGTITAATLNGDTLDLTVNGSTYAYHLDGAPAGAGATLAPSAGGTGTSVVFTPTQAATAAVAVPIDVGDFRVGTAGSTDLSVSNTSTGSDGLTATVAGFSGGATASGSVQDLAPGATDGSDIAVTLTSASPGAASGSITLDLASDAADGTVQNLPSESFAVTGSAFRLASGTATVSGPVPTVHDYGDTVAIPIAITNTALADGYSEQLVATGVYDDNATFEAIGTTAPVAAGDTDTTDLIVQAQDGFDNAGAISGDVTIDVQSVGAGTDGAPAVDLGTIVIPVSVNVVNYANPFIGPLNNVGTVYGGYSYVDVDFGTHPQSGKSITIELGVGNGAQKPADDASGYFIVDQQDQPYQTDPQEFTLGGAPTVSGVAPGTMLAPGADITFNLGTIGAATTEYEFIPTSPEPGFGADAIRPNAVARGPAIFIEVSGTVDPSATLAMPVVNTPSLVSFGAVHENDPKQQQISIGNAASPPAGSEFPAEALDTTIDATGAARFLGSDEALGLGAGNTNADAFNVELDTSNAGAVTGIATLDFVSDGSGIDNDNPTTLEPGAVTLTSDVYAYASADITSAPTIVHVGDDATQAFTITNDSGQGAFSEALIATAEGGDSLTVDGSVGPLADGASDDSGITFVENTESAGYIFGSATFGVVSDGDGTSGLGDTTLDPVVVSVPYQVNNYASADISIASGNGATLDGVGPSYTLDLGTIALDSTADTIELQVQNGTLSDEPSDSLDGVFSGNDADGFELSGFGDAFTLDGAGSSQGGFDVSLDTSTAGTFEATLSLAATSDNPDGSSPLDTVSVTVIGTVAALALADITPGTIDLGSVRVNDPVSPMALTISNTQPDPAQALNVTATGEDGAVVSGGTITGLKPADGPNTQITVGANDDQPGTIDASVSFDLVSDDGNGTLTPLPNQETPVVVTGTVYALATPSVSPPAVATFR